jgi:hypothetical protein
MCYSHGPKSTDHLPSNDRPCTCCTTCCRTGIGGTIAPRTAEQGADSVMWAVDNASAATHGLFYKDGQLMSW